MPQVVWDFCDVAEIWDLGEVWDPGKHNIEQNLRRRTPLAKLPILHSQKPEQLLWIYRRHQFLDFSHILRLAFGDSRIGRPIPEFFYDQ